MKKYLIILPVICILIALILTGCTAQKEGEEKTKIVTSFYPMYVMLENITKGVEDVTLENMTQTTVGCLHNYTLQTSDLRKIEKADIFIENGLGLENFIDKITKDYPKLKIIDASKADIKTIIDEEGENGHIWNSIVNYKKQIRYIQGELSKYDEKNRLMYKENADKYIEKIDKIDTYKAENEETVISCNEALAYILNDANLETIEVYTDHDQSSLSSGKISEVIDEAKEKNVKAIFVEKNDNIKNAQIIANETGAKIIRLDAGLTGNFAEDSYINSMTENYKKIKEIFENKD